MSVRKYFYSIVFFLFMALLMSLPLTAKGVSASKATSYETYCPYQNPPKDEDLPKTAKDLSPKVIDKGDFYFSKIAKVNLLRFRDRVAITGEATRIEHIIQGVRSGKDHRQKNLDEKKNIYLYTFMDVAEELEIQILSWLS